MGFLQKLLGGMSGADAMRLDILMEYSVRYGTGTAALQWTDPMSGGAPIQAILVALIYGRTLINHKETREELFGRVGDFAMQNVRSKGAAGFDFSPWVLHVGRGGGDHTLWPWHIVPREQITNPKIYSAILKYGKPTPKAPTGRWLHLRMAMGLERVLAPSSALIAIAGFSQTCDQEMRYFLALYLWQMNAYWGSPNRVSLGTEALAYAAAHSAIRSGQLRVP